MRELEVPNWRTLLVIFHVLVLMAGCAREGGSRSQPSLQRFCTAVVDGEAAASGSASNPSRALTLLDRSATLAPADIKDDTATLATQVRRALSGGGQAGALSTPAFERLEESIDGYVAKRCGYPEIKIIGKEYSFSGLPPALESGRTTFALTNEGEEVHEMSVLRVDRDVTEPVKELLELSQAQAREKVATLNADIALQDETNREVFALTPGRYGLVCSLPEGATSLEASRTAEGPPHFERGMLAEFTVR